MTAAPSTGAPDGESAGARLYARAKKLPEFVLLTARDAARLARTGHVWPSADEPSRERRLAQLAGLCGDEAAARPSVFIVVAHADDEVLWAGSRLLALRDRVSLAYVTDGAPRAADLVGTGCATREEYAALRRRERDCALAIAGIRPDQSHDLGLADQESRFQLGRLTRRIGVLIDRIRPDIVLTHAYEAGHPDHDAVAFAVHMAVRVRRRDGGSAPALMEFAGYHRRFGRARAFEFLPAHDCDARTIVLDAHARERKEAMYACYSSQSSALQYFHVGIERFRCAPHYDFHQPGNWERTLFSVQRLPGEPHRTLPTAVVIAAEAELRWRGDGAVQPIT